MILDVVVAESIVLMRNERRGTYCIHITRPGYLLPLPLLPQARVPLLITNEAIKDPNTGLQAHPNPVPTWAMAAIPIIIIIIIIIIRIYNPRAREGAVVETATRTIIS